MLSVKEIHGTIQGEGAQAGIPMLFVRFTGCNMWTGLEKDRESSAKKNNARCPNICDTDFIGTNNIGGGRYTENELVEYLIKMRGHYGWVCLTGGEPLLQVRETLVRLLKAEGFRVAIETNGSIEMPFHADWVTCSPKQPAAKLKLTSASEIKVLYPLYDPHSYDSFTATHRCVQPVDGIDSAVVNSMDFVLGNRGWRISLQLHKIMGIV